MSCTSPHNQSKKIPIKVVTKTQLERFLLIVVEQNGTERFSYKLNIRKLLANSNFFKHFLPLQYRNAIASYLNFNLQWEL